MTDAGYILRVEPIGFPEITNMEYEKSQEQLSEFWPEHPKGWTCDELRDLFLHSICSLLHLSSSC